MVRAIIMGTFFNHCYYQPTQDDARASTCRIRLYLDSHPTLVEHVKATGVNDFLTPDRTNLDPAFGVKVSGKLFEAPSSLSKLRSTKANL
jgi:hypothetical protein